jgi:hypothetical protein
LPIAEMIPVRRATTRIGQSLCVHPLADHKQDAGDEHGQSTGDGRDRPPRHPVGEMPRRQCKDRQREELREADEPEIERVVADRVDLPADRDHHHLRGEAVRQQRRPQQSKWPEAERGR